MIRPTEDEIRKLLEAWEHMSTVVNAALTERAINFGLHHGLSPQEIQALTPRNEDGSPASLAGAVLDALITQEKN
jgi:hypothetical protein